MALNVEVNMDSEFWATVVNASAGLVGVGIGGFLTWFLDTKKNKAVEEKELTYLAIILLASLNDFFNSCYQIAMDDGIDENFEYQNDGFLERKESTAYSILNFSAMDVNWKVLPANLLYKIFLLPDKVKNNEGNAYNAFQIDEMPELSHTFEVRQYDASVLGIEVIELIREIRNKAKLPANEFAEQERAKEKRLLDTVSTIEEKRKKENAVV